MKLIKQSNMTLIALVLIGLTKGFSFDPVSYPECDDENGSNIQITTIIGKATKHNPIYHDGTLMEPISFDLDPIVEDGNMHVDIYFNERRGIVNHYDARNNKVTEIGSFDVMMDDPTHENGMSGLVLP